MSFSFFIEGLRITEIFGLQGTYAQGFVTALCSVSGKIYRREKETVLFHVETGEVANMLKGGNGIQNHLGELDRTRKLCKQDREELKVNVAEKGQVVVWH